MSLNLIRAEWGANYSQYLQKLKLKKFSTIGESYHKSYKCQDFIKKSSKLSSNFKRILLSTWASTLFFILESSSERSFSRHQSVSGGLLCKRAKEIPQHNINNFWVSARF